MRTALILVPALALACGGKDKSSTAAPEAAAAADPTASLDIPGDADSKKFANALLDLEITNFKPSDGAGALFKYDTMDFAGDNTWSGAGFVEMGGERMECTESGKWSMDPAVSASEADMTWTLDATDCAGREAGADTRVNITLNDDGWDVAFR